MDTIKLWARNGDAVRQAIELGELVHLETASAELAVYLHSAVKYHKLTRRASPGARRPGQRGLPVIPVGRSPLWDGLDARPGPGTARVGYFGRLACTARHGPWCSRARWLTAASERARGQASAHASRDIARRPPRRRRRAQPPLRRRPRAVGRQGCGGGSRREACRSQEISYTWYKADCCTHRPHPPHIRTRRPTSSHVLTNACILIRSTKAV